MPVIQDTAGNPLITQVSPMIGFVPVPAPGEALDLIMYQFIIEIIRQEDQKNGAQFLERYLEGPQSIWGTTTEAISNIPTLWDVSSIADRLLQYLKNIVGWTPELDAITDPLDALTLRRLIAASVPFWKRRGPEDTLEAILHLVTGVRLRIWNWFDFRIVMDETAFGEDWNGYDPWMISLPGPPDYDEQQFNVRIVDNGTLDRGAVANLVKLSRPSGERVEISYIGFLDLFRTDDDNSQWVDEDDPFAAGDDPSESTVDAGSMIVAPTTPGDRAEAYVGVSGAADWNNYLVTWRVRGTKPRCTFYRTSNSDMYYVEMDVAANLLRLHKVVAGADSSLVTPINMFTTFGVVLKSDVYYAVRVEAIPEAGQVRIRVYWESAQAFSILDFSHAQGSIGVGHAASGTVELNETELFFNPLETDMVDINP